MRETAEKIRRAAQATWPQWAVLPSTDEIERRLQELTDKARAMPGGWIGDWIVNLMVLCIHAEDKNETDVYLRVGVVDHVAD